jgi:predicted SnoaL-like aldol condensation-catalyzing enzyme
MSPDELVRRFSSEVFNDGRTDAAQVFIHADHRNHDPTAPEVPAGREGVRRLVELYRSASPRGLIEPAPKRRPGSRPP